MQHEKDTTTAHSGQTAMSVSWSSSAVLTVSRPPFVGKEALHFKRGGCLLTLILWSSNTDTVGLATVNHLSFSGKVYFTFVVRRVKQPFETNKSTSMCVLCWGHVQYRITTVNNRAPSPWSFWLYYGHSKLQLGEKMEYPLLNHSKVLTENRQKKFFNLCSLKTICQCFLVQRMVTWF